MPKMSPLSGKYSKEKYVVLSIFGLALLLRLIGSVQTGFVFDELIWIEKARKVSFSLNNFNLVLHGAFHPFLEVYIIKLSTLLFDNSLLNSLSSYRLDILSVRFLHVVLSSSTVIIIYYLVRDGLGKSAATFAAFLVALCQFHLHFSRTVIQTAPLLFFVTLSLLFFWKAVNQKNNTFIILTGLSIGLAYLCEETAALLFVIFFVFLAATGRLMQWLKKWETAAAVLVFLLIISPDLYWNMTSQKSDITYHLTRAAKLNGVSLVPTSLFAGELFLIFIKDIESFVGGFDRRAVWSLEYPPMHWVLGLLCLVAAIYSIRNRKKDFIKLMLISFFFLFAFFSIAASSKPFGNYNFWWASICFIPAIILASGMLSEIFQRNNFLKWVPVVLVLYLFGHTVYFLSIKDNVYVRRPSFLAKYYLNEGRNCFLKGENP